MGGHLSLGEINLKEKENQSINPSLISGQMLMNLYKQRKNLSSLLEHD